ncbi:MAG: imidazole glycerol phosphate synthase subunit HisF [Gemmatimonadaceae bacterium]|nr:imidazole glycerol phosphate synthase subunit HisF [Gemmatimonadaceae bacterium]
MTLTKRVVACLDVSNGRVVKGTKFVELRDIGDPAAMAASYEAQGADEIVFLDISATPGNRSTMLSLVRKTAEQLFIPLAVGGGIRSADDVLRALDEGADKVAINSAAVTRPAIITESADRIGSQCVTASIDVATIAGELIVVIAGGRKVTGLRAVEWARECADRGAGEIILTSIDRDGARSGYDLELTAAVADAVSIPVVASGGAGSALDVVEVLQATNAQAALVAGILHEGTVSVGEIKSAMRISGIAAREAA